MTVQAGRVGGPPLATARQNRERFRIQRLRRGLAADLLYASGWVSIALAIALYLAYGGMYQRDSVAHVFKSLGILAGLVATDIVCLQLLLAARIPWVDRTIGHDKALAEHSRLGKWAFIGLGVHAVLLLVSYAMNDVVTVVTEAVQLWSFADFRLAVVGLAVLAVVGVTCIREVRRRTDHDVWWLIHLGTYVAVLASLPHMFSMSGVLGPETWQHWFWIGMLGVTFFSLLMWRGFLPLFSTLEHRLVVTAVDRPSPDVVNITMTGRRIAELGAEAGQFFHWRFIAPKLWWHQHPFSISAMPQRDQLRVTARNLGPGTARLMNVKLGTRVAIAGPYGIFSDQARTQEGLVLVGFGIGIAPIRAILEETPVTRGLATVILRASHERELYLVDEVADLCRRRGARLVTLVGHRAESIDGRQQWVPQSAAGNSLRDFAPYVAHSDVFVCGPQAAADLVVADALAAGTPPDSIHNERFAW